MLLLGFGWEIKIRLREEGKSFLKMFHEKSLRGRMEEGCFVYILEYTSIYFLEIK